MPASRLVNANTTSRNFAEALRGHHNLHVVTNGLTVAIEFARSQNAPVYLFNFRQLTVRNRLQARVDASFNGFIEVTKWVKQKGVNWLSKRRHWGPW